MQRNSANNKRYREKYPERARAHWMVQEALRKGELFRGPCEICGNLKVHAHHDDYTKPLDVRWLCHKCHEKYHHPGSLIDPVGYVKKPKELWKGYSDWKKTRLLGEAKELRLQGKSYTEIGTALSVSRGTVFKWLNAVEYN